VSHGAATDPTCPGPIHADKTYRMLVTECNNPQIWDPATNNQLWQFRRVRPGGAAEGAAGLPFLILACQGRSGTRQCQHPHMQGHRQ